MADLKKQIIDRSQLDPANIDQYMAVWDISTNALKWITLTQLQDLIDGNLVSNNNRLFYAKYMLAGDYADSDMIATAVLVGTDGVALVAGDIVLRNYSSNKNNNGLWVIQSAGSALRYDKCNTSDLVYHSLVQVQRGLSTGTYWHCTNEPGVFGTNDINYEQKYLSSQALETDSDLTFNSITLDDLTASELVAANGSKKIVSLAVATYPSLAELAYVKGVTSAIQTQLDALAPKYAGFYAYNKTILLGVNTADTYHAFHLVTGGDLTQGLISGFTYVAGRNVDANITSEANGTGGKLRVICSGTHSLTTGDLVVCTGMNNAGHNKPTRITTDGTNPTTEFLCDDITYVAGAGASAGVIDEPAQLIASAGSAGIYFCGFVLDGIAAAANKDFKFEIYNTITAQDNIVSQRLSTATQATMAAHGNIQIAVGDRIWLACKNITDTSEYTVKNANINLHKIKAV